MVKKFLPLLFFIQKLTYANYTLYEITAFNAIERTILYNIHLRNRNVCFVNDVTNEAVLSMNVVVNNCCYQPFENRLYKNNIQYAQVTKNFSEGVRKQERYHDWNSLYTWINKYVKDNTALKKMVIARTFENRDIFVLKLSTGKRKIAVFIMGGEIGIDCLTPAIIMNLIRNFLEKKLEYAFLTDYYNFYFLPFMNPDGYVYSKNENRFWTKNRKKFIPQIMCSGNFTAEGVNLNRNWHFSRSSYNALDQECNSVYVGQKPLSEEETQSLADALNSLAPGLVAFINLKGFNRLITIPYGSERYSINHDILMELIKMASVKVKEKHNVTYYVGKTSQYIYNSSGNVADWVKMKLNIPVVYTVYIKNDDTVLGKHYDVEPLTDQLETILNETLTMAKDIYGPLFSSFPNIHLPCLLIIIEVIGFFIIHTGDCIIF